MEDNKTLWWILAAIILTVVGFAVIPPLIKRYSSKLYREINKREKIDFDDLGPKIVKKGGKGARDGH